MNAVIILFLSGLLLLAAEVFLPGVIAGIFGGVAMIAGCIAAFQEFGAGGGVAATGLAAALLGLTFYTELVWLPKTRWGKKLIVQSTLAATSQPPLAVAADVVGKPAEAITPLGPSGYVLVEGRRYEAFCQSGHVTAGGRLRVVGLDNFRLIVTQSIP
jgi:membrane-bound ClpP family serine protease